jgi:hypothetical protein
MHKWLCEPSGVKPVACCPLGCVWLLQVTFSMRYTGSAAHPAHHQELPAVFVNRRLSVLALYTGDDPRLAAGSAAPTATDIS